MADEGDDDDADDPADDAAAGEDDAEGADEGEGAASAWESPSAFVKWLIPSFGLLFVLVGYVVHSAHESLLGFPDSDTSRLEKSAYAADAADFLRDLLTSLGDLLIDRLPKAEVSLGGHGVLVLACVAAAALAIVLPRIAALRARAGLAQAGVCTVLVLLVAIKFVVMDAPLTHLEHVMVGSADFRGVKVADDSVALRLPWQSDLQGAGESSSLAQGVLARSALLWSRIACSRVAGVPLPDNPDFSGARCNVVDAAATAGKPAASAASAPAAAASAPIDAAAVDRWRRSLAGEYLAHVLCAIAIAVVAARLMRSKSPAAKTIAMLALFSLLSVPYAYGKLMQPVNFIFARVSLVKDSPHGSAGWGFLVGRDGDHVDLLEMALEKCSSGDRREARFTSLPSGQILAIEQIYRRDVITWKVEQETSCPAATGSPLTDLAGESSH